MRVSELRRLVRLDDAPLDVRAADVGAFLSWVVPIWLLVVLAAAVLLRALL